MSEETISGTSSSALCNLSNVNNSNNSNRNYKYPRRNRNKKTELAQKNENQTNDTITSCENGSRTFSFNPHAKPFIPSASHETAKKNPRRNNQYQQKTGDYKTKNRVQTDERPNLNNERRLERNSANNNFQKRRRNFKSKSNVEQSETTSNSQERFETPNNVNGSSRKKNERFVNKKAKNQRRERYNEAKHMEMTTFRESIVYQLENDNYECAICYQRILPREGVWSCKTCYHLFHISHGCIISWAKSSRDKEDDNRWRCPTCQTKNDKMPYDYYCFCGKRKNPPILLGEVPHSCGEICARSRANDCPHKCADVCHPGPCIECEQQVIKSCNCAKTKKAVRCGTNTIIKCEEVCEKLLSCGKHKCKTICHQGPCEECPISVEQSCFCGQQTRVVPCSAESSKKYSCDTKCDGFYSCNTHKCQKLCHERSDDCGECYLSTNRIKSCPCGKKTLKEIGTERKSCTDPIPTCDSVCNKVLECGFSGNPHRCMSKCHTGECPPCPHSTSVVCRCGNSKVVLSCTEYLEKLKNFGEYLCKKRCRKKKSCGVHKCQEVCCIQVDHTCLQICNKKLSCGNHNCDSLCHLGSCQRCLNASFEEQYCHCGKSVRMPPIACGEPPPECHEVCTRPHNCDHPVLHNCHHEDKCPPCMYLMEKWCYGKHEIRPNVPCHIKSVSCGIMCNKPLSCGVHNCSRTCHGDACENENEVCKKPCNNIRNGCEHPCGLKCHGNTECEPSPCMQSVSVTCECGRIKKTHTCWEVDRLIYLKVRITEENDEGSSNIVSTQRKRTSSLSTLNCLECDEKCLQLKRNLNLAEVLGIDVDENGETCATPTISYPSYMKIMVKTNMEFVKTVEETFGNLLNELDQVKDQLEVRYHTPPLHVEKRRFIHEYAAYFNLVTESVDQPPKRSVIITAKRSKVKKPLILISEIAKYKGALDSPGFEEYTRAMIEGINNKEIKEMESKKILKTEKIVYKRESQPIKPREVQPIQKSNKFLALLNSDSEVEDEKPQVNDQPRDWWEEEEKEKGENQFESSDDWIEVKPKTWTVEVEVEDFCDESEILKNCEDIENEKFDKEEEAKSSNHLSTNTENKTANEIDEE